MTAVEFTALEYQATQTFGKARYRIAGDEVHGFSVARNGKPHLELGPGYRLLNSCVCGVCSTDLDRHHLPFPLPQVTGHEVVARDEQGRRCVVEINATHRARRLEAACPYCSTGLSHHCPDRLVLGIHDLPGGFGEWLVAPLGAIHAVPAELATRTAVLVEPFAAALHAVTTVDPQPGESVAVLGPRRLGLLVVAALAGHRTRRRIDYTIVALSRHEQLLHRARRLGADETVLIDGDGSGLPDGMVDRVIDTTGSPSGLELALRIARREVHLKSTHGRPAGGLTHLTELVVDELSLGPYVGADLPEGARGAWLVEEPAPGGWLRPPASAGRLAPAALLEQLEAEAAANAVPRVDQVVVASAAMADRAIRPSPDHERSLAKPCGEILVHPHADTRGCSVLKAVVERGLRVSSSRCGDFREALTLLAGDTALRRLGDTLVTHTFPVADLPHAFDIARAPECVKVLVEHDGQEG